MLGLSDLNFQPLVSLSAGRIIGFTAHARDPGGDVLLAACRAATTWPDGFTLGIALSPAQWHDPTAGLRVLSILGEAALPPARLELEITETTLDHDTSAVHRAIDELRQSGVLIALSGCNTGTASLSFCFDTIKLDRGLVRRLDGDREAIRAIEALIALAEQHSLVTAAEGIATSRQRDILNAIGCAEGQGELFGRSLAASEIPPLLRFPSLAEAVA